MTSEVTNISKHGLWLLTSDGEHFLPFADFPWFRDAPVGHILNVEEATPGHYYWPDLDVDLSLKIIRNPSQYPLTAKTGWPLHAKAMSCDGAAAASNLPVRATMIGGRLRPRLVGPCIG